MLCGGDREKGDVAMEEKWDYVNLDDFKSESCLTPFSYFFIWVLLFISIAVYGVDTFTAINLLAFSRWSGRVQPAIPFNISRWIFAACIIASLVLLAYRWIHAIRAIRSGSITRSFLDPLAVRIQSVRFGQRGRGYRRFLVFAELTKNRKAAEYVALYAYFSFQFWMNTIFADGPRQVLNAITLYSVMQMDLMPGGKNAAHDDGNSSVVQFFHNVKILAEDNTLQAVVLFAKTESFEYCRRKNRAPTQPMLATVSNPSLPSLSGDKVPTVASLSRSTTETTLPPYSRSNLSALAQNPTLPNLEFDAKPTLARTGTSTSAISETVSLTGNAAGMGYTPLDGRNPTLPTLPPVPPLPPTIPSRMATPQSRASPVPYGNGDRNSPGPGYRNLTDSSDSRPNQSHTPMPDYVSTDMHASDDYDDFNHDHVRAHYNPYSPPRGTYGEEDEYGQIFEAPGGQRGAPSEQQDYYSQDPYLTRSCASASTGEMPTPYRHTPANTDGTPVPYECNAPASYQTMLPPQAATYTPPSPRMYTSAKSATTASQTGGYIAFNPSMAYNAPQTHPRGAPGPSSCTRANTASPSAMHRGPPGHTFNRANTHQY
ncbi:hypothetical protein PDIDSM_5665 [Penicillium digitatum]|nr:hypothetical protein PDIDSM_5665 [Penicillium digitatum]